MTPIGHTGRQRIQIIGLLAVPLAVAGWLGAGAALGAGSSQPSMEVLPKTTGLQYSQTVEIKGHHLPKGSGSVAATICGLTDGSGKTIAKPTADDCAGANEIGKLVIVKSWQSNGEFDTKYTLPASGQTFGKNARFCNRSHKCALVVADANPDNPAYHVDTPIQFFDQASSTPTTKPKTTTTKPKSSSKPTPTTTAPKSGTTPTTGGSDNSSAGVKTSTTAGASAGSNGSASFKAGGSVTVVPPSGAPTLPTITVPKPPSGNPVPAPVVAALDKACGQLADAVKSAGGDPSALLAACSSLESGNGPQQLQLVLQSPSLLCVIGASAWQNNQQVTDACNQAATAIAPVTSQLAGALGPVLGGL
jgi:hypothetical protein